MGYCTWGRRLPCRISWPIPWPETLAGGILRRTAQAEGPVNLRNAATLGGLVAGAEPDSELYAALLALDAQVLLSDGETETTIPLADLTAGDVAGKLITGVTIPIANLTSGHARVARTPSDRPIVAAIAVVGDGVERVAVCGVAPRPVLSTATFDPATDFKASAEYRAGHGRSGHGPGVDGGKRRLKWP